MPLKPSNLPKFNAPQVPILSAEPPEGGGWIHEIKHGGFRTLPRIDRGDVRAFTRGGHDWSDKYEEILDASGKLKCPFPCPTAKSSKHQGEHIDCFHRVRPPYRVSNRVNNRPDLLRSTVGHFQRYIENYRQSQVSDPTMLSQQPC